MQSVPITTNVVSSNPAHGKVYSIQQYLIVYQWLVAGLWFFSTNKTDRHDITEILFKVVLNITTITFFTLCHKGA